MLWDLIFSLVIFFIVVFGVAWPLVARLALAPAEKLVASAVLSLLAVYLVAWTVYLLGLPVTACWILPVVAVLGLVLNRPALAATIRDGDARALLAGQILVTGWCVGGLLFVASYSGGGWASDWFEHWARALFFLDHWRLDTLFLGLYALPARPPLANLATGAFLAVTAKQFAHYQLFTTLLNSLAVLPAGLLARRFGAGRGRQAIAVLVVLLMLNPSFVENATFAWTKLITVCFILSGLYFFLRTLDPDAPRAAGPLCATALAAALLAHYSAGPYVLLLAVAWFGLQRNRWATPAYWQQTAGLAALAGLVLATWFGWSFTVYGAHTTLLSNSSVTVKDAQTGNQLLKIALNLRDTLVPHFLRPLDGALIAQSSRWGYVRDWWFQLYQVNLFFVFGSLAWLVLIRELVRGWATANRRWFWAYFIGGVIVLGVAVHGARDTWGLAHICLQALVVLGLAFLASRWGGLGRGWRIALAAGAVFDLAMGLVLHFAVQSYALDRWLSPRRPQAEILQSYSQVSLMNAVAKAYHQLAFFRDVFTAPAALALALLAGILTCALIGAYRRDA